jgi:hypothetical protein
MSLILSKSLLDPLKAINNNTIPLPHKDPSILDHHSQQQQILNTDIQFDSISRMCDIFGHLFAEPVVGGGVINEADLIL